jgi:predicted nucleic acid-binding protein
VTLFDTDIVFEYLSGGNTAAETKRILQSMEAAVSTITFYELFAGVVDEKHLAQREEFIELCEVVELTASMARSAARLYTDLKAQGRLIANEDLLIAATALETGYPLFTKNRSHFERIPGLVLV